MFDPVYTEAESEHDVLSPPENQGQDESSQRVYKYMQSICNENNGAITQSCR